MIGAMSGGEQPQYTLEELTELRNRRWDEAPDPMTFFFCDHCNHHWNKHDVRVGNRMRCQCGCMWERSIPPAPPEPLPDPLIGKIVEAIWAELLRQSEADTYGLLYVEPDIDLIDGDVDMRAVAEAIIRTCRDDWRCTSCDGCSRCDWMDE